ncbi:hypothetical protein [Candidatus Pelagibacter sp.]|uniref:hypothetical protein n=1 Tax=Candidatus Pelagibacter sp. TaxID=2024849 RepID=UPI003F84E5D7|tara:strand:+ start:1010 stop:1600 length:591 start_codon:yes stop_codon:yes gene_type:complete
MNFIQNYFQKRTNNMIANQDYELAEQFMNSDMSFCLNEDRSIKDGKTVGKHLFQMEGIFLDLTDRTLSHPKVPFAHEDRGGKFANIVKEAGLGNRKVIWRPSDLFDLDEYMDAKWFPEQLEMYHKEFNEMMDAKDLYCERSISFLDYFFKRLDIYNACQMPTFIKYYRGVDLEKYKDKIRLITDEYPYQNKRGEFI